MPPQPDPLPTVPQRVLGIMKFLAQFSCASVVVMAVGSAGFLLIVTLWRISVFLYTRFLAHPWQ